MENTLTLLKDRGRKWKFLTKDHGEVRFCQNVVGGGGMWISLKGPQKKDNFCQMIAGKTQISPKSIGNLLRKNPVTLTSTLWIETTFFSWAFLLSFCTGPTSRQSQLICDEICYFSCNLLTKFTTNWQNLCFFTMTGEIYHFF